MVDVPRCTCGGISVDLVMYSCVNAGHLPLTTASARHNPHVVRHILYKAVLIKTCKNMCNSYEHWLGDPLHGGRHNTGQYCTVLT